MSDNKQTQMNLSRLYRAASTFGEGGGGHFKSLLKEAFTLNIVDEHEMAKAFKTEVTAVRNWRKGNAPSITTARQAARYVVKQLDSRLKAPVTSAGQSEAPQTLQRSP